MARGYPTREAEPPTVPEGVVPAGVCAICKREEVREGEFACAGCAARLAG